MGRLAHRPWGDLGDLVATIAEDWRRHGRDWTRPGFRAVAVYRFGVYARSVGGRRLCDKVRRRVLRAVYRTASRLVRNVYGIELHATATVGRRFRIAHQGAIVIHRNAVIGDDCQVRQGVTIGAGANRRTEPAPVLGDRVSVGAGALIIGPITIGDDVKVGPGALVMRDVPSGATVFAPPARMIVPSGPSPTADGEG